MTDPSWRNYPSPWWVLWLQRAALMAVGVWCLAESAWIGVASTVLFLTLHSWMIHRVREDKVQRDAYFAEVMRRLTEREN